MRTAAVTPDTDRRAGYNASIDDSHFQLLLHAARSQPEPQRLLFVFAAAALPGDATADQRLRFEAGEGGELAPVMCVDKDPHALTTFDALKGESEHTGQPWQVMFVVGLSGRGQHAPTPLETEAALNAMVEAVRQGSIVRYAAYDARGEPLGFS
ncbi:MAG: ribonucleotide reductase subunit alpha [Betaproteobacteria bacterium]